MALKKKWGAALASVALVFGAAMPAYAATTYPKEGGVWHHGINGTSNTVYSKYYHGSRYHKASVISGYGMYACSTAAARGTASALAKARPFVVDSAYYGFGTCR